MNILTILDHDSTSVSAPRVRTRARRTGTAALLAVVLLLFSSSSSSALMGGAGLMWTVWSTAPVRLVVCWENPAYAEPLPGETDQTSGAQRREYVRLALKHSWERATRIVFAGWQTCQNEGSATAPPYTLGPRRPGTADENVKIEITSSGGGQNPAHGSWGDYAQHSVILNLHCGSKACIESLAIHEFGHVLGLYHEEERSDWPTNIAGCPKQSWPVSPPWWPVPTEIRWGSPDRNSVMAYCSGGPTTLSPGDIAGIQRAYERHLPGTLLSLPGSLCLSAHANAANGDNAFGWECDEAYDDQEWHYDTATRALYIQWPFDPSHTKRCLDMDTTNYTDVQIWNCLNGSNQQWNFQKTVLRGYGGLCLTRPAAGTGALTMQTCTGTSSQLWRVVQGSLAKSVRFRSDTGDLCLTLNGGSGSNAVVGPCTLNQVFLPLALKLAGSANPDAPTGEVTPSPDILANGLRDFYMDPQGMIRAPNPNPDNLCLDVQDVWDSDFIAGKGGPAVGRRVQFFKCYNTQLNQKWTLSGHVVSANNNKCLALSGTATTNGSGARIASCSSAPEQDWDYAW